MRIGVLGAARFAVGNPESVERFGIIFGETLQQLDGASRTAELTQIEPEFHAHVTMSDAASKRLFESGNGVGRTTGFPVHEREITISVRGLWAAGDDLLEERG